jgi:serine/threonine-protein kinase
VYRATDTNLKRSVAIKVLPESVATDRDRLSRFQREAEVLASLNHPNIAAIYGLERSGHTTALVMELVEGPTLADRIAEGPIPVDEALPIAKQIAEALEAAHEQGIIHRDLKPANIKLRPDGTVKVLDFGLAKALGPAGASSTDATASPTITSPALMTGVGVLLGTAAYMSPEQTVGKAADKRSDLWAFGVVLMEMLTGRPIFAGETVTHVLAAVLKSEPDWTMLPPATSPGIRRLLRRSLEKDRKKRLDSASAARLEIDDALAGNDEVAVAPVARSTAPSRVAFAAVGMFGLGLTVAAAAAWMLQPAPSPPIVSRLAIPLAEGERVREANNGSSFALSPDGTTLVYSAVRSSGPPQLFRRDLASVDAMPIPGTAGGNFPVFSPDGQSLAFVRGNEVLRISVAGGPATSLYRAAELNQNPTQLNWGPTGITFGFTGNGDALMHVRASGGPATALTKLDAAAGETDHRFPHMLSSGEAILFTVWSGPTVNEGLEKAEIVAQITSTGERRRIIGGAAPQFLASGHLLFVRTDGLWAVPFSAARLETTGSPVRVLEGVLTFLNGLAQVAVSSNGALAYQQGTVGFRGGVRTVTWVTRSGAEEDVGAPPRPYAYARLSPDETQIALDARDEQGDIWVWNTRRRNLMRLTFDPGPNISPVWSPDGTRVAFGTESSDGGAGVFWTRADGAGSAERLASTSILAMPTAFTRNDRLLFHLLTDPRDISALTIGNPRAESVVQTSFDEANAELSPDGRWLAYQSNESGRYEIYVRPFPNVAAGRWQVSNNGGAGPIWARNGRTLFYMALPPLTLMEVPIEPGTNFVAGTPHVILKGPNAYVAPQYGRPFDVSADGQRFLMLKDVSTPTTRGASSQQLILVQNWAEELKRLVPTN